MTTAIRPKSRKDWAEEVPGSVFADGTFTPEFNGILFLVAAAGRVGFDKIPKRLPITEQTLIAFHRNMIERINDDPNLGGYLRDLYRDPTTMNAPAELLSPKQTEILLNLGRSLLAFALIGNAKPEVGHFVGNGSKENEEQAQAFLRAAQPTRDAK